MSVEARVNPDLIKVTFDDLGEAERFESSINELILEWLPWAQAVLGPFVAIEQAAESRQGAPDAE